MMAEIINTLNHFAKEQPDKIAVRHIEDVLTYKELDEASSKLAHQLQDGKKPMVLYGHMSPYMIVGMLGAIKAGLWLCTYRYISTRRTCKNDYRKSSTRIYF